MATDFPGFPIEDRVSNLEQYYISLNNKVERLARDLRTSFKEQADYMIAMEQRLGERFDKLANEISSVQVKMVTKQNLVTIREEITQEIETLRGEMATKNEIHDIGVDLATFRGEMATKQDIANMATQEDIAAIRGEMATKEDVKNILAAFQQLLTMIDARLPEKKE